MAEQIKKTGATPIVEEGLGAGEVLGVTQVRTALVRYRDGYGEESVRLAVVIPGGEVYFYANNALDMRPAQGWIRNAVKKQIGE